MASKLDAKILNPGASPRGWHRLQLAAECLQKYAWEYELPVEVKEAKGMGRDRKASPLAIGSLVHLALAQHYARLGAVDPDEWCEPEEAVELIAKVDGVEQHVSNVLNTYAAYVDRYSNDVLSIKPLEVESLLSTTIGGQYLLTGRSDLIYEDPGGRVFLCDHKTSARITAAHKQFYAVSGQLLGYAHMARQKYGERFCGVVVNLIQHGREPKFERVQLERSPNLEARFERIVVDIEQSIDRCKAEGRNYDDWPKAINEMTCYGRYGACPFISWCRYGPGASVAGNWSWEG